jgi:hypothetical protein
MSQFHNIFCASDAPLTRAEISTWVSETWYGDGMPAFDPAPDDQPAWDRFEVGLPAVGRPLVFLHDTDPAVISMHVAEAIEEAAGGLPPTLVSRLEGTRQVIGIELMPEMLTDDAWELLDAVQSLIATNLEGILITNDGIYDAQLRPIASR